MREGVNRYFRLLCFLTMSNISLKCIDRYNYKGSLKKLVSSDCPNGINYLQRCCVQLYYAMRPITVSLDYL